MNELFAPISLLGLLCTSQSVSSKSIWSSLEFSFSVLLISFLVSLLFSKKTPKKTTVLSLKTLVRGCLVGISTTIWGYSIVRIGNARSILIEISILVLLSSINEKKKDYLILSTCFCCILTVAFSLTYDNWFPLLLACISVTLREIFHLFKDVSSIGAGGIFSLLLSIWGLFTTTTTHVAVTGDGLSNRHLSIQWLFASALLWIVPNTIATTTTTMTDEKWYEYTQIKKSKVTFGLACVILFAFMQKEMHSIYFVLAILFAVTFLVNKKARMEKGSSLLPTTVLVEVDNKKDTTSFVFRFYQKYSFNYLLQLFRELTTSNSDSKKIFYFLCLTLSFMMVEIIMGLYTGSLGLISDAGHMFFDSAALFIGLFASYAARWRPDSTYTYGYARYETLAGFVNAIFLAFVAVFVLTESLERFTEPPEIRTEGLLLTSVLGLVVNGIGLVFFHEHSHSHGGDDHSHSHGGGSHSHQKHTEDHSHSHSGGGSHSHSKKHTEEHGHSHGNSHSHNEHAHSHDGGGGGGHSHTRKTKKEDNAHHGHSHGGDEEMCDHDAHINESQAINENMHGVYLHVLADALGSIGVIASSLMIQYKGWYIADPICSFCISVLIFMSVIPLLKSTATSLMLKTPIEMERKFDNCMERCKRKTGVIRVNNAHLWRQSKDIIVATVTVVVTNKEFENTIQNWLIVSLKNEVGVNDVTVQVCTEALNRDLK